MCLDEQHDIARKMNQTPQWHRPQSRLLCCRDMLSTEDSTAFFLQLLHGLLANLQPSQQPEGQQVEGSPLREPCREVLPAVCQLVGPQQYLHQVLQSVPGLTDQAAPVEPKTLEVSSAAHPWLWLPFRVRPSRMKKKGESWPFSLLCVSRLG